MSLKDKKIIVTGGCSGLGEVFTKFLLKKGAFVIPTSRKRKSIDEFVNRLLPEEKDKCIPEILHFENESTIDGFINKIKDKHGEIYGLVNNAVGRYPQKYPEDLSIDDWSREYHVNVFATFYLTVNLIEKVIVDGGSIVNISSFYSKVIPDNRVYDQDMIPTSITYASSKAALNYITKYLATYYAKKNIRINAILPGGIRNPKRQTDYFIKQYEYRTPLGRMANRLEFNEALHFLLSENNSYCTGQCILIDGGWSIY